MKKNISALAALLLLSHLVSCGNPDTDLSTTTSDTESSAITTTTNTEDITTSTAEITTELTETTTVAPAEIKPIKSIFLHSHNLFAESSAWYGYTFFYFTPDMTATGQTKKTPINTDDPLQTANLENQTMTTPAPGAFDALCEDLWELRFDLLPETVERAPDQMSVADCSDRYLIITFEDGSTFTSSGYAADKYNVIYRSVYDRLYDYSTK